MTNIDYKELAIATAAGALSGGVSALYAEGGAVVVGSTVLSQQTSTGVVVATASVGTQINNNINQGISPLSISPIQVLADVVTDNAAGKIMDKVMPQINAKPLEQQLDRTTRVSTNDPTSAGRTGAMQTAQKNLNTATNVNYSTTQTSSSLVSSFFSVLTDATKQTTQSNTTTQSTYQFDTNQNQYQAASDNTTVKMDYIPK